MFISKSKTDYELWKHDSKKNKSLREMVDENLRDILEKLSEDIISKNYNFLQKKFDKELLKLHLKYNLLNYVYPIAIELASNKKLKLKNLNTNFFLNKINFGFNSFLQITNSIINSVYFLNLKKKNLVKKKYPIMVEYFYGVKQKNDFPDINNFKRNDILFLFRQELDPWFLSVKSLQQKKFNYDYICLNKLNSKYIDYKKFPLNKISTKTRESLKKILIYSINSPKKAFINSFIIKFILDYEIYYQIFKRFDTKVFVHSLTLDKFFAPIRQALDDCNAINVNYLRSYYTNKINSFLAQPDEIIFSWGKFFEKNFDKKSNINKNIFYSKPYFAKLTEDKKLIKLIKKKTKNKKIISLFDTSAYDTGIFSPQKHDSLMQYILNYVVKNKDTFLIIKYKNPYTKKAFKKRNLINKLSNQKRILEIETPYYNTLSIYKISKLIVSMNTLSIGTEALYHGCDSLNLLVKSFNKSDLESFNKIYPFGYTNMKNFSKIFEFKMKSKKNIEKLNKLRNYIFHNYSINSSNFIKYFIEKSKNDLSKTKIIKEYIKKQII